MSGCPQAGLHTQGCQWRMLRQHFGDGDGKTRHFPAELHTPEGFAKQNVLLEAG